MKEKPTGDNLISAIHKELDRCRELKAMYLEIPTGGFGVAIIEAEIKNAEKAIEEGDVIKMLVAYDSLKKVEG